MRIVCPSCQAAYEVPEKLLSGPPRKVRCARCGDAWTPVAVAAPAPAEPVMPGCPAPMPAPEAEPEMAPPAPIRHEPPEPRATVVPRAEDKLVPEPAEPPPGRGLTILAALAWAASIALLAGAGWACVAWRADIMAVWAPSRRLFALLGLA